MLVMHCHSILPSSSAQMAITDRGARAISGRCSVETDLALTAGTDVVIETGRTLGCG